MQVQGIVLHKTDWQCDQSATDVKRKFDASTIVFCVSTTAHSHSRISTFNRARFGEPFISGRHKSDGNQARHHALVFFCNEEHHDGACPAFVQPIEELTNFYVCPL